MPFNNIQPPTLHSQTMLRSYNCKLCYAAGILDYTLSVEPMQVVAARHLTAAHSDIAENAGLVSLEVNAKTGVGLVKGRVDGHKRTFISIYISEGMN